MAVPKQRRSKAKKRTRKANWKIELPALRPCPTCSALGHSHRACLECGQYKGKHVITSVKGNDTQAKDA